MSSTSGGKRKRGKAFYHTGRNKRITNQFTLEIGMKGFMITCNGYEKQCVNDAYNLLNEYADKLYGQEKKDDSDSGEDDIDAALEKEVALLKKKTEPRHRRFQVIESGANNCIIIRTSLDDPCYLVHHILQETAASQVLKSRHIQRFLPISGVCRADLENIGKLVDQLAAPHFSNKQCPLTHLTETSAATSVPESTNDDNDVKVPESNNDVKAECLDTNIAVGDTDRDMTESERKIGLSFCVMFRVRNSNLVNRDGVLGEVTKVIMSHSSNHFVDLTSPDFVIIVEVIRNKCCVSVIKDYFKLKKYNLHELIETEKINKDVVTNECMKPTDKNIDLLDSKVESNVYDD